MREILKEDTHVGEGFRQHEPLIHVPIERELLYGAITTDHHRSPQIAADASRRPSLRYQTDCIMSRIAKTGPRSLLNFRRAVRRALAFLVANAAPAASPHLPDGSCRRDQARYRDEVWRQRLLVVHVAPRSAEIRVLRCVRRFHDLVVGKDVPRAVRARHALPGDGRQVAVSADDHARAHRPDRTGS